MGNRVAFSAVLSTYNESIDVARRGCRSKTSASKRRAKTDGIWSRARTRSAQGAAVADSDNMSEFVGARRLEVLGWTRGLAY